MIKIGITGSVASGKSTVAKILSRGIYPIFSADKIVKKIYKKHNFKKKIKKTFNIKTNDRLKIKIKEIIKKKKINLNKLEKIIHPIVRAEMHRFLKKENKKICILEIPLLFENKLQNFFDVIVFVHTAKNKRIKRFVKKGGTIEMFKILNKKQLNPKIKIKKSNYIFHNNKSIKDLKKNVNISFKKK